MIRKNKRDISPGRIRNTSKPQQSNNDHSSPKKQIQQLASGKSKAVVL